MIYCKIKLILFLFCTCTFCQKASLDNCAVLTVMKSGTHLLHKLVYLLTNDKRDPIAIPSKIKRLGQNTLSLQDQISKLRWGPKEYISSHFNVPEMIDVLLKQRPEIKSLIMVREPRDILISLVHFINKTGSTYVGSSGLDYEAFSRANFNQKLASCICAKNIQNEVSSAFYFSQRPNTCLVFFENLVGSKGGGSDILQEQEVRKIACFLNLKLTESQIKKCCSLLFGGTKTFRKGQINQHKHIFTAEHESLYQKHFKHLVKNTPYEIG